MRIDAEVISPFLESAALVFRRVLGMSLVRGKTTIRGKPQPGRELAIIVGVKGSLAGQVVYAMNLDTAYKIAHKVNPKLSPQEARTEYRDIMGEMANMITGNAVNMFSERQSGIDLTVPVVLPADSPELKLPERATLSLNLYSRLGLLEVNIALAPAGG